MAMAAVSERCSVGGGVGKDPRVPGQGWAGWEGSCCGQRGSGSPGLGHMRMVQLGEVVVGSWMFCHGFFSF